MNANITLAALMAAALATTPAHSAPKPIKGRYNCKGSVTITVDPNIPGLQPGTTSRPIKAKLVVANNGAFDLDILTKDLQNSMIGGLPTTYSPSPAIYLGNNAHYKSQSRGCLIAAMWQRGSAAQNRNGRKAELDLTQDYYCAGSDIYYTDRYRLTCKR